MQASTDQSTLDMYIADILWAVTLNLVTLFGNIFVMSQAAWQVFIVLIPVMAACIWYQVVLWIMSNIYYLKTLTADVTKCFFLID